MKYMGSKARLVKEILPLVLANKSANQWYVEPFAGGMNMICEVPGKRLANDINYFLIEMWRELISGWVPLEITKEEYIDVRKFPESYDPWFVGWVGFNCSYSGKWFGGYAGKTQTKIGTIRDYQQEARNNVIKQTKKMQDVLFVLENKEYNKLYIPPQSIVYCDPPYFGTTDYKDKFDHSIFWDWARTLANNGHKVYVSEYQAPNDFKCIWSKEIKSSLSANGKTGGSKRSVERLFVYNY